MGKRLVFLAAAVVCGCAFATAGSAAPSKAIAGGIATDSVSNVFVTGSSLGFGTGLDFATIKYNSNGASQWVRSYNGPANGDDVPYAIVTDSSGNIYVTGSSLGVNTGLDFATVKYNSSGSLQWVARYDGPANSEDIAYAIAVDNAGNVYVTGSSTGFGTGLDYATVKYNSNGVQQWVSRYNGPASTEDIACAVAVDGTGNVYVTGSSVGSGTARDYATLKMNSNGVVQWIVRYNGPGGGDDVPRGLVIDGMSNVYITGSSLGAGSGLDYATLKYNSSGTLQWVARYDGPGDVNDTAYALALDGSGNVIVTGSSLGRGTGLDFATVKYNTNGQQQWVARYNGPGGVDDIAYAVAIDSSSNVYVTGSSLGFGTALDYATLKYNASGTQQWAVRYNGPANGEDVANSLVVSGAGNIHVTGSSLGSNTGLDYATLKFNASGSVLWAARFNGSANSDDIAGAFSVFRNRLVALCLPGLPNW